MCKINALFSPRLALFMLVFLSVKMRGKQGRNHLLPLYSILCSDCSDSFQQIQPCTLSSLWPTYFFTSYRHRIREHESTSLSWWVGDVMLGFFSDCIVRLRVSLCHSGKCTVESVFLLTPLFLFRPTNSPKPEDIQFTIV